MFAWIAIEQALLIGQNNQRVSTDQIGNQCRQIIVIAKLDLVGGDGIVFVNDRDAAKIQQGPERTLCI